MDLQPTQPGANTVHLSPESSSPVVLGRNPLTNITDTGLSREVLKVQWHHLHDRDAPSLSTAPSSPRRPAVKVVPASAKIAGHKAAGVRIAGGEWRTLGQGEAAVLHHGDQFSLRAVPVHWVFSVVTQSDDAAAGAATPAIATGAAGSGQATTTGKKRTPIQVEICHL